MLIYLLRHGETIYNAEGRYQGYQDIPLSETGRAALLQADFDPECVFVSPLSRAKETATLLFPTATQRIVEDLREMSFGVFEGRSADEMSQDADYRRWVDSGCRTACPDGEDMKSFSQRTCTAFAQLLDEALARSDDPLVIVAHGGTQMAVMGRYVDKRQDFFSHCAPNAGGYLLEVSAENWQETKRLKLLRTLHYVKGADQC